MSKNKKQNEETEIEVLPEETAEIENEDGVVTEDVASEDDVELLKLENQKLREDYLRAFADAENTKKRCAQEIEKNNKYAIASFAKELLSVADNLH
ncbi:MAG: nucleotide exchange factor GrpE, partial [Alphaproteobacteria bacterium]|nr:nucleotide exchange factor GrpE [Alphaproteobacteria bacterium]